MIVLNSVLISVIGLMGSAVFYILTKIPESMVSSFLGISEVPDSSVLAFSTLALFGILTLIFLADRRLFWSVLAVVVGIVSIVLTIKTFVSMEIPRSSLILLSLIVSSAIELFATVYLGLEEAMIKSNWRG